MRSVLIVVAMLILGGVAGYASLALGPVGWVLVSILTILVVVSLRRRPLGLGTYLGLLGATGAAILVPLVIGSQACPADAGGAVVASSGTCYAPSTLPAVMVYLAVLLVGLILSIYAITRGPSRRPLPRDSPDR
jgi:hypothetical protein